MNILLYSQDGYAKRLANAHISRVLADGGIVQSPDYVYEWYKLSADLGRASGSQILQWRRKYNALAGVKLNNISGTDYVQKWYDLGTTSDARVDALQTTAANQPLWATDSSLPSGIRAPSFDGSNDVMSVADLGIFRNQTAGTIIVGVKDAARAAGDATHQVVYITTGIGNNRAAIQTRSSSNSVFRVAGRRLDADSEVSRTTASADGLNTLVSELVWGGNTLVGVFNGVATASTTFSSGAGATSDTNSTVFNIGAENATTSRLNGIITDVCIGRIVTTTAQLAAYRALEKRYYSSLP